MHIGHAETSLSSSHFVIACSAARTARSWLAALLSTTPLHSSFADLLLKSDKSKSKIDDARLFRTGTGFSAFGEKCNSMSFSRRRVSRFSSVRLASERLARAASNSSVRCLYTPLGWKPARYGAGRCADPTPALIPGAGTGDAEDARDSTAYGTCGGGGGVGVGAITTGVVGRDDTTAGVVGLDGACDGCAAGYTFGNGLFLFPGDRRCGVASRVGGTSVTGALAEGTMREVGPGDAGKDMTEKDRAEAFESVRTCAGAALLRWDVGRRGEGRAGWVLFNARLETTRNLDPGRGASEDCKGGRAEGAVLDDGEDGPGDDRTEGSASCEREEEGRDAGSAGSWFGGESGWEPDSLSVVVCSGVGDGVGSA